MSLTIEQTIPLQLPAVTESFSEPSGDECLLSDTYDCNSTDCEHCILFYANYAQARDKYTDK